MQLVRRHGPARPAGQITRGKTASNRLRRVDNWPIFYDPALTRAREDPFLPKNLIHRVVPGERIYSYFESWKQAYREALPAKPWGPGQLFVASARGLAEHGYAIDLRRKWLAQGYLLWRVRDQA